MYFEACNDRIRFVLVLCSGELYGKITTNWWNMLMELRMAQRIDVELSETRSGRKSTLAQGWFINDFAVGYREEDAEQGNTLTVMVSLTNLTSQTIDVVFPFKSEAGLIVTDKNGSEVVNTVPGEPRDSPKIETLALQEGKFWTTTIDLDNRFSIGDLFFVTGVLASSNYPSTGTVPLTVRAPNPTGSE